MSIRTRAFLVLLLLALFALFHVAAWARGSEGSELFTLAYRFTAGMFLAQICVVLFVFGGRSRGAVFLETPLVYANTVWLVVQAGLGLVAIYRPFSDSRVFTAICCAVAIAYAIALILILLGRNSIVATSDNNAAQTQFMRTFASSVESFAMSATDSMVQDKARGLAEKIRYSDPVGSSALAGVEMQIQDNVDNLKQLAPSDKQSMLSVISTLDKLLDERNKLCLQKSKL